MKAIYVCENCKRTFYEAWTEAEAMAEYATNFPDSQGEEKVIICDDCYRQLMREWKALMQ